MSSTNIQARIEQSQQDQLPITMDVELGTGTINQLTADVIEVGGTVVEFRLPMCEQMDFTGLNGMGMPPGCKLSIDYTGSLPSNDFAQRYSVVVLLLSDADMATPGIKLIADQLANDRRLGSNYTLPENVVVIISNTKTLKTGV